ncbi:hypothetical protein [Paenibacillus mendelii]|uniref:N-acylglucosamine-6-phosphate 2-epimerase n=1 Tax=Paenibacillus mendelii TaxID=206163 RepID=A0ABV6JJE9_9BACL|nr:hypothetical protein [Paenibacillus mendelii]
MRQLITAPSQVNEALKLGAQFVVIGSAITRPRNITETYIREITQ